MLRRTYQGGVKKPSTERSLIAACLAAQDGLRPLCAAPSLGASAGRRRRWGWAVWLHLKRLHPGTPCREGRPSSPDAKCAGHCPADVRTSYLTDRSLHFFADERMMRFTVETDTPDVRAIVGAFRPAPNDARMRFAFPSGISTTSARSVREGIWLEALGAEPSSVPPVEAPRRRLAISASTAACSR